MTARLITQCPQCTTSFKVEEPQLKIANGMVRCGSCLHVFNALDHSQVLNEQPEPPQLEESQDDNQLDLNSLFNDQSALSQKTSAPSLTDDSVNEFTSTGSKFSDDEINEELLHIPDDEDFYEESMSADELFGGSSTDEPLGSGTTSAPKQPTSTQPSEETSDVDESWAEKLLDELDSSSSRYDADEEETFKEISENQQDDGVVDIAEEFATPENPNLHIESEPVYLHTETETAPSPYPAIAAWSSLCLVAVLGLVLQLAWFKFEDWSKQTEYRGAYQTACNIIGCQLPSIRDINRIRTSNLIIRSDREIANTLNVDAVIANQAPFEQPFPQLALIFSNNAGKDIASAVIKPNQYVNGELSGRQQMPINTPIHISFLIEDPGSQANSYRIEFYP